MSESFVTLFSMLYTPAVGLYVRATTLRSHTVLSLLGPTKDWKRGLYSVLVLSTTIEPADAPHLPMCCQRGNL